MGWDHRRMYIKNYLKHSLYRCSRTCAHTLHIIEQASGRRSARLAAVATAVEAVRVGIGKVVSPKSDVDRCAGAEPFVDLLRQASREIGVNVARAVVNWFAVSQQPVVWSERIRTNAPVLVGHCVVVAPNSRFLGSLSPAFLARDQIATWANI